MNDGSHYYDRHGNACFEVPNKSKPGQMRAVTITDARKLGLLPSVTTCLGILEKSQLTDWKHRQITEWCSRNVCLAPAETVESYHSRAMAGAFQQVSDAADLGTAIHKALEQHFKGESYDPALEVHVKAVDEWMQAEGVTLMQQELRLVNLAHGYAGTTDAVMHSKRGRGILDFKSRKTKPGEGCKPWDTQPMQIAAYHVAHFCDLAAGMEPLFTPEHVGCNVFISTTEPGRVEACWYDHQQLAREWEAFCAVLTLYRHVKNFDPREIAAEAVA